MNITLTSILIDTIEIDPYSIFGQILTYLFLFIVGSFLGYIGEVLFRRFVSMKRWINPGFLKGPCLPLYGFGLCLLHGICEVGFHYILSPNDPIVNNSFYSETNFLGEVILPIGVLPYWATSIIVILLIGLVMTLLELIAGLIFIKGLKIKLRDYSHLKGNYKGLICPLFSFIWMMIGVIYWFGIRPPILDLVNIFINYIWILTLFIGFYYAILLVDFINSLKLSINAKGLVKDKDKVIDFEKFKINLKKPEIKNNRLLAINKALSESSEPQIKRLKDMQIKIKKAMYINGEIVNNNESETPRTIKKNEEKNKKE